MAIKISKITGTEMGPQWQKIVEAYAGTLKQTSLDDKPLRKGIERAQKGLLKADDFLDALAQANSPDLTSDMLGDSARGIETGIRAKWSNVNNTVKALAEQTGESWQVDHQSITPINQRVTGLIEALEMVKDEYIHSPEKGQASDVGRKLTSIGITTRDGDTAVIADIDKRVRHLKTARAYLKELDNVLLDGSTISEQDLARAIAVGNGSNGYDITSDKINDVSVLDGDGNLGEFAIITEGQHTPKSDLQSYMGAAVSKILDSNWKMPETASHEDQVAVDKLYNQIINDPIAIIGSEGIENSIERQMHEIFEGKTPKKRKSRTKTKTRIKAGVNLKKSKVQLAKLKAKKRRTKALLQQSASKSARKTATQSVGGAEDARAAMRLKRLINQKLPAEVRRNMGRPALINRTGRFSNSVILESLTPSPAGMVGTYSYQYRPYETFENTGKRKWPVGYNPKPLITKSIRNLAIQHMETKLTLRRT